jgi:GH15 family glucan-1,4-alpha-glucosidase
MRLEDLGLIGNCQYSALIDTSGSVAWCCLPRFDSEPVFASLLDEAEGGHFRIGPAGGGKGVQSYLENTNVLETRFETPGGVFRVLDFAPRFRLMDRHFRPTQLFRIVEVLEGSPRVSVDCRPVLGWSKRSPERLQGSNHVRYEGFGSPLRLTTDVPLSYLDGQPFVLTGKKHLVLSFGPPPEEGLETMCQRFLTETVTYWRRWVKHCSLPTLYQEEVIRSALVLKLHCFDDTGAIVAATTTSLPEAPGSGRTWDYRYCWLRDSFYVLGALRLLGHFDEREKFVNYLLDVAAGAEDLALAPLYRIDGKSDLSESILEHWPGYERNGPVRVGNQAAEHVQNDVYGEMVLALAPIFLDPRFRAERTEPAFRLLEQLARKAVAVAGTPDAGIWEYRTEWRPQTFSNLMCWAGADRMARVAALRAPELEAEFRTAASRLHAEIVRQSWNAQGASFAGSFGGKELDASLLQMASLRFLPPDDPRLRATVDTIQRELDQDGWLLRYKIDDGFGRPEVAFLLCTFWLVEALAIIGRQDTAQALVQRVLQKRSPLGLFSEDIDTRNGRLWGNFPQAYSHVGLIHAAFAAAPRWSEVV